MSSTRYVEQGVSDAGVAAGFAPATLKDRALSYVGANRYAVIAAVASVLGALALRYRLLPFFGEHPVRALIASNDSAIYLRLFDLVIESFPRMPSSLDYYSNYPWGLSHFLPPIWSYLLAMISIPLSAISGMQPMQAAGLLVVLLSAGVAVPVYYLAREVFGARTAPVAALVALFMPRFVLMSEMGLDHHVADVLLVTTASVLLIASKRYYRHRDFRRFFLLASIGGAVVAVSMLLSLSLLLIYGLLFAAVVVSLFIVSREDAQAALASAAMLFGSAAALLGALALATPWFAGSLDFARLSYLHVAAFAGASAVAGAVFAAFGTHASARVVRLALAAATIGASAAAVLSEPLAGILIDGYYRSIGSYPLGKHIGELQPLFKSGFRMPVQHFGYVALLTPVILAFMLASEWRARAVTFERALFYAMLASLGFLTIQASYYGIYLAIFLSLVYAEGISIAGSHLTGARLRAAAVAAVVVAMIIPSMVKEPLLASKNLVDLAAYLRINAREPGNFYDPSRKPSYGVMTRWSDSYQLQYVSQRPTVATGNTDAGINGIAASELFYQTVDEDEAVAMLKGLRVKYVVASSLFAVWVGDLERIGAPSAYPDQIARRLQETEIRGSFESIRENMAFKLYLDVMTPTAGSEPLHHFRVVYASYGDSQASPFLLYEVVKGAHISLKAKPHTPVTVTADVHDKSTRILQWRDSGVTDGDGVFSTIVPYSTTGGDAGAMVDAYTLTMGDKSSQFDVDEAEVLIGGTVSLNS